MFRKLAFAAASLAMLAGMPALAAKQCRDTKGKFVKCPPAAPAKPQHCRGSNGKFAKCGVPGSKPV